ncbi:MAG: isoprenylcysteine carboxylmethyltransferase family protein [Gracilimonas sp.]|uniref:methyltransferase family protein n=1 Tax=Gracilimonas sp. TaxID=1974203 RepID=UPI0019B94D49|nr:isoprenylcysteine carboxylmethyltransferase family protein [Gracilimonas sp.]MBD3617290.1 isoprenylcysteine carboxylmethyltransferase family protein [Gracilimonas sp.]
MLKLKIPPVIIFLICIGLMWTIHHFIPNQSVLFEAGKFIAIGLMTLGGLIGVLGVIEFARESTTVNPHKPENTKKFVQSGVYKFSRNPMYLGLLIVLLSPVFYWGNAFILIILPLFVWYMNEFQIKPEEEAMKQKFGDKFLEYKKEVRRWI